MAGTILGSTPPVGFTDEKGIASTSHSAAKAPIGALYTVWDPVTLNWSVVAYYQAGATVLQGDALVHDDSQYGAYRMVRGSTANAGQLPRGFAAANVSNTAYYSFRYIAGYCPTIKFGSGVASNAVCALCASYTAGLSDNLANATLGTSIAATTVMQCAYSLDVMTTTGVNSGIILGFLL